MNYYILNSFTIATKINKVFMVIFKHINILFFLHLLFFSCNQIKLSDIKKNEAVDTVVDESFKNKLFVYIIESEIVSKQLVGTTPDNNYVHNKMLRGNLDFIKSNNLDSIITDITLKDSTQIRKVQLEYFTGHKCGNCPIASNPIFDEIETKFGNKVNIIKVHASTFANPSSTYPNDFRTELGNELLTNFGISNLPIGIIDRINFPGSSRLLAPTEWTSKIQIELNSSGTFGIWESHKFNVSTLEILASAKVKNLNTKKIYGINFKGKLKSEWVAENCYLVFFLTDSNGNVIQSITKSII